LVETTVQEKPLSIALREVNAGKLSCTDVDPEDDETVGSADPYDPSA
jgi:DNA-directed RNA polymerase subunit omega